MYCHHVKEKIQFFEHNSSAMDDFNLFSVVRTVIQHIQCNVGEVFVIGKGNLYLTENPLSRNELCCVADTYSYMIFFKEIDQILLPNKFYDKGM